VRGAGPNDPNAATMINAKASGNEIVFLNKRLMSYSLPGPGDRRGAKPLRALRLCVNVPLAYTERLEDGKSFTQRRKARKENQSQITSLTTTGAYQDC
jgi:hypothetical protein